MSLRNLFFGGLLALLPAICLAEISHGQNFYSGSAVNRYGIGGNYNFGNYGPYATRPFSGFSYSSSSFFYNPSNLNFPFTSQYYVPGRHPLQYSGNLYGPYSLRYGTTLGGPLYAPQNPVNNAQTTNIYNSPINSGSPNLSINQPGRQSYQSFYPAAGGPLVAPSITPPANNNPAPQIPPTNNPAPQPADVQVRVPNPEAQIWFEEIKTRQTGMMRSFVSPPLQPGKEYRYTIRAQWTENGQVVEQSRTVLVRAGNQIQVDFTQPENP